MQNNFPKIQLFFSILFLGICLSAFLYFYKEINNNNQKVQLVEEEWQKEITKRGEIKKLNLSVEIIEAERKQLETHFAQSSDIVPFLDTIERLVSKAGAKAEVTSVDILADYTGLMVGIKTSGTFDSLYKFLTLLENSPYELELVEVDMHKETESDTVNKDVKISQWNAIFQIKLLSFIE